jgi:hypothetical protein
MALSVAFGRWFLEAYQFVLKYKVTRRFLATKSTSVPQPLSKKPTQKIKNDESRYGA